MIRYTRMAAMLLVLGLAGFPAGHLSAGQAPRYAVIIVLDGARPDELSMVPMPHLQSLIARGVTYRQAFVGQELANTPPSHATIGTGMLPRHDGVVGFLWQDPRTNRMTDPTAIGEVEDGALEAVIRGHHVPTLAGRVKAADQQARVTSVAAHKCYASDAMGTAAADYILCALIYHNRWVAQAIGNHRPPPGAINNPHWDVPIPPRTSGFGAAVQQWRVGTENAWTVRYALWAFHRIHYPRVMMLNLSETDVLGHFTTDPRVLRYLMREFDALLGQIIDAYRRAGLLDRTDFVLTADHGMSPIRHVLPFSVVTRSVALAGATPVYYENDTAATIGIREQGKARQVALNVFHLGGRLVDATFYKVRQGRGWAYRLAAAQPDLAPAARRAYELLADTMASANGPTDFIVYPPGVSSRTTVAFGYHWEEGHLGPQWVDQHIPLILAGPGVRQGRVSDYPARLVDIAPTVEALLGADFAGEDGVVLADALRHPPADSSSRQQNRAARLRPVIQALQQRWGIAG
jgi:arylsulfatase A-like enzyme